MLSRLALLMLLLSLTACTTPDILDCRAANGLTPDCRFENPEDLAVSPRGTALIISEMGQGSVESRAGRLVAYVPGAAGSAGDIRPLWPRGSTSSSSIAESQEASLIGDPACPALGTAAFVPHGINSRHHYIVGRDPMRLADIVGRSVGSWESHRRDPRVGHEPVGLDDGVPLREPSDWNAKTEWPVKAAIETRTRGRTVGRNTYDTHGQGVWQPWPRQQQHIERIVSGDPKVTRELLRSLTRPTHRIDPKIQGTAVKTATSLQVCRGQRDAREGLAQNGSTIRPRGHGIEGCNRLTHRNTPVKSSQN